MSRWWLHEWQTSWYRYRRLVAYYYTLLQSFFRWNLPNSKKPCLVWLSFESSSSTSVLQIGPFNGQSFCSLSCRYFVHDRPNCRSCGDLSIEDRLCKVLANLALYEGVPLQRSGYNLRQMPSEDCDGSEIKLFIRYRFMYMYHWTMLYQSLSLAGHDIGGRAPSAILLLGSISLIKQ